MPIAKVTAATPTTRAPRVIVARIGWATPAATPRRAGTPIGRRSPSRRRRPPSPWRDGVVPRVIAATGLSRPALTAGPMAASSATAMLTGRTRTTTDRRQRERGRQPERLRGALDHRLTGDRADDHAGDGADRHGHEDLGDEDGRHLDRREPDGLHDPDVAIARQDDPADDVGDGEGGGEESEDRECEQDRDVQLRDRVDVGLRLEIGRRGHHGVRREARGDPADRRREVGGSARRVDAIEHLLSGFRVGGQRRKIGGAHPGGDVRGADRRGDADHRERPAGSGGAVALALPGRHEGRAARRRHVSAPLPAERRLDVERHRPADLGAEQRGRVLVEDDLTGRLPPPSSRDGHPVDRVVRRGPPGHDLVADQVVLPRHASTRDRPRDRRWP